MPHGIYLASLRGDRGQVTIPALGAVIATIEPPTGRWSLRRREDENHPDDAGGFTLHVVFSYINRHLWDSPYEHEFVVRLGKHKQFRLTQTEGEKTELEGRSLLMEGVSLWPLEAN
jgi:hypothetical protein